MMTVEITEDDKIALEKAAITFLCLYEPMVRRDRETLKKFTDNRAAWKMGFDSYEFCYWVVPVSTDGFPSQIPPKFDYHDFQALKPRYLSTRSVGESPED